MPKFPKEHGSMIAENDPFYLALKAIEPDYPYTEVGAAFVIERVAAFVNISPRLLRAWLGGRYKFRTFGNNPERMVSEFWLLRTPAGPLVMGRSGVCYLKKCLDQEPRPLPPFNHQRISPRQPPRKNHMHTLGY
jgi:hypothetical protein